MNRKDLPVSRRHLLKQFGMIATASSTLVLLNCGGGGGSSGTSASASDDTTADASTDTSTDTSSDTSSDTSTDTSTDTSNSTDWLSGGTASMEADFPPASNPFDSGLGNLCTLTEEFTVGPCFFDVDDERDDISEGQAGVPMTLAMKVVDASCNPVADAVLEVWWCNAEGIYSGDDSDSTHSVSQFNTSFCTDNDAEALASRWFRGIKTTDSEGMVYFKGCFPGWYPSRTTHIHFRIVLNNAQQLISQFGFDDDLANAIYVNHSDYTGQAKDTSNARDTVFPSNEYEDYLFEVERQWDGSMLVYKAVQINV